MNTPTNDTTLDSLRGELMSELSGGAAAPNAAATTEGGDGKKPGATDGSTLEPEKTDNPKDDKPKDDNKPKVDDGKKPKEEEPKGDKPAGDKPKGNEAAETDYAKARKDKERFRVNWSEMEKEKTELKAKQAELERQRQEIAQARQQVEQERLKVASDTRKASKYTPEQLERYAKEFEAEGKPELAQAAMARAKELRQAIHVEQQQLTQQQQAVYVQTTKQHWDKAQADFPDVAKTDSPLRQRANEVYKTVVDELTKNGMRPSPSLQYLAVQHADALLKAEGAKSEIESLQKKVTELETENKRLTKSTALPGAKPAQAAPAAKDFKSLTLKQQGDALQSELAQVQ